MKIKSIAVTNRSLYPGTEVYKKAISEGNIVDLASHLAEKDSKSIERTYINALNHLVAERRLSARALALLTSKQLFDDTRYSAFRGALIKRWVSEGERPEPVNE